MEQKAIFGFLACAAVKNLTEDQLIAFIKEQSDNDEEFVILESKVMDMVNKIWEANPQWERPTNEG